MIHQYAQLTPKHYRIQNYPYICEVATRMAYDNDCINREETVEDFYATTESVLASVDEQELHNLNQWLETLTDEQMDTLADGEHTEVQELKAQGPTRHSDNAPLANIFDDIFEAM